MKSKRGFTIIELVIVVAVLAIVSAIVVPHIFSWRSAAKLRGAANNLKGDLEMAKVRAVKEKNYVTILFFSNRYEVFVDSGEGGGTAADWTRNGTERLLRSRQLPAGVELDLGNTSFGAVDDKTRFNSRGRPLAGSTVLVNPRGDQKKIVVSAVGRIRME